MAASIEFEIDGKNFRAEKMDAMKQFHVSRKIAPIIPNILPVLSEALKVAKKAGVAASDENALGTVLTQDLNGLASVLQPLADALSDLSDESSEFVIYSCLSVVSIQHQGNWVRIATGKVIAFDDLELPVLMKIVFKILQHSLGPFISGMLTSQQTKVEQ